jgi:hypothetical protein
MIETLHETSDYTDSSRENVERSWTPNDKDAYYIGTQETMEEAFLRSIVADFHITLRGEWVLLTAVLPYLARDCNL